YGTTNSVPLAYDNDSGTLVPLTTAQWGKHALYIVGDGADQKYLFIYGQQIFLAQAAAETGPLPIPPSTFTENIVSVSAIIVTFGDTGPLPQNRFLDIRPTISFRSGAVSSTADHNSLLNLTVGNAHPQYFRVDGT